MKKRIYSILTLFVIVMLSACSDADRYDVAFTPEDKVQKDLGGTKVEFAQSGNSSQQTDERQNTISPFGRKVIKEGSVAFTTDNVMSAERFIKEAVIEFEGYIAAENIHANESTGRTENSIVICIPSMSFDQFLSSISAKAGTLDRKDIITKDVTEDYIDTEARIRSKKALEERYFEMLKQAHTIDDILKVESQLATVRNEIELAQGHLNYLQNKTSFSTLEITYYEPQGETISIAKATFGTKFSEAIHSGWNVILQFILGVARIWPALLFIGLVLFAIQRYSKKAKAIVSNRQ